MAGDWRSLGQFCRKCELPEWPAIASVEPICMGDTCGASFSSFGDTSIIVVEECWALIGDNSIPVETCYFLDVDVGALEGVALLALWTPKQ